LVLVIDQAVKIYIKTHFAYNEEVSMFGLDWAKLHFVENEGMAFGITFDWTYGKLVLSLFRVLMVMGLIWYIRLLIREKISMGFVVSISLITAGALGNIIDSAFYGLIFSESSPHFDGLLAHFTPLGEGYGKDMLLGGFMHGKVVDMFYFPMKYISMPDWIPYFGGEDYLFFSPIFNVADAAITCGVLSIFLFQRQFFKEDAPVPAITQIEDELPADIATVEDVERETLGDPVQIESESIAETTEWQPNEANNASETSANTTAGDHTKPLL
jgi:signal peptidase II